MVIARFSFAIEWWRFHGNGFPDPLLGQVQSLFAIRGKVFGSDEGQDFRDGDSQFRVTLNQGLHQAVCDPQIHITHKAGLFQLSMGVLQ